MSDDRARIVSRRWSYCQVLRGDGLSYQDYLEQLTALLFLKMAEEQEGLTSEEQTVPQGYRWSDLAAPTGRALYRDAARAWRAGRHARTAAHHRRLPHLAPTRMLVPADSESA